MTCTLHQQSIYHAQLVVIEISHSSCDNQCQLQGSDVVHVQQDGGKAAQGSEAGIWQGL